MATSTKRQGKVKKALLQHRQYTKVQSVSQSVCAKYCITATCSSIHQPSPHHPQVVNICVSSTSPYITLYLSSHSVHTDVGGDKLHFLWAIWAGWYRPQGPGGKENSRQNVGNVRVVIPTIHGNQHHTILASDSVIKQTHFPFHLLSMGLLSVTSEQVQDTAYLFPPYQKCSRFLFHFCNLHRTHPGYPPHARKRPFQFSPDGLHRALERYVWYFLQVGNSRQTASSTKSHMTTSVTCSLQNSTDTTTQIDGHSDGASLNCLYTTSRFVLNWWFFMLSQALITYSK